MFKLLEEAKNLETLKKAYRKLAVKYHPDHFKDDGTAFIKLQETFEKLFTRLKNEDKDAWMHKEAPNEFMSLIDELMKFPNLDIEQIGGWLYVTGSGTYNAKEQLKALKFWWSSKHRAWIYSGKEGKTKRRATKVNPRKVYGSQKIASTGKGKETLYIK